MLLFLENDKLKILPPLEDKAKVFNENLKLHNNKVEADNLSNEKSDDEAEPLEKTHG